MHSTHPTGNTTQSLGEALLGISQQQTEDDMQQLICLEAVSQCNVKAPHKYSNVMRPRRSSPPPKIASIWSATHQYEFFEVTLVAVVFCSYGGVWRVTVCFVCSLGRGEGGELSDRGRI